MLGDLRSGALSQSVPYAVIEPPPDAGSGSLPLCVFLMGGGGSRQSLVECQPLFEAWWAEGVLAPMALATPSAGLTFYVEDPESGVRWEAFILEELVPHLRATTRASADAGSTAIMGISMGGYGALKTAFAHPHAFAAVVALNPMVEPGYRDSQVGARNRLHHTAGGPPRLLGPSRDPDLVAANHPANRARTNAARLRESGLAIYLEVGDNDFVNAHDGTEFLHRVLWDLDLSHEYHLVRGADHGGATFRPRLRSALIWLTAVLTASRAAEPAPEDRGLLALRAEFEHLRDQAAAADPTTRRRFGILPPV